MSGECYWPPVLPQQDRFVIQASGHHPRVCGCCYCLPAPHARLAPLRVPGGNCRSGDQSPKVHGVHLVHVSQQLTSPKRAEDFAMLAGEVGRLAPSLTTITRKKAACRLRSCRLRRVVTGSTPPVTTRGLASVTTALGNAAIARCATVAADRKRLRWRFMREVLASSDNTAGGCRPVAQNATQGFMRPANHEERAGQSVQGACHCQGAPQGRRSVKHATGFRWLLLVADHVAVQCQLHRLTKALSALNMQAGDDCDAYAARHRDMLDACPRGSDSHM